jgi:hypothetical protein
MQALLWLIQSLTVIFGGATTDSGGSWDPNGSSDGGSTWDPNG